MEGSPLAGLSADLAKFFDLVDPHIAIDLLEELGLPKEIVGPLRHFYDHLWRIMTLNGVAGKKWFARKSALQGCAWSNPLAVSNAECLLQIFGHIPGTTDTAAELAGGSLYCRLLKPGRGSIL